MNPLQDLTRTTQRRVRTARAAPRRPDYLEVIGPLSKFRREARKESSLLEEIIKVRRQLERNYNNPETEFDLFE
jgi:hypothetical protein